LHVPKADSVVLVTVFAVTTFGSLINAVGIGIILASLLFMKRSSDLAEKGTSVKALAGIGGEQAWEDEKTIYDKFKDRIYIKHLYGPMFFGFTSHFQNLIKELHFQNLIKELDENIRALIIRMDRVPHIDQTGLYALEEVIFDLQNKGVLVLLTGVQSQPQDMLRTIDIVPDLLPESRIFDEFEQSIEWLKQELMIDEGKVSEA